MLLFLFIYIYIFLSHVAEILPSTKTFSTTKGPIENRERKKKGRFSAWCIRLPSASALQMETNNEQPSHRPMPTNRPAHIIPSFNKRLSPSSDDRQTLLLPSSPVSSFSFFPRYGFSVVSRPTSGGRISHRIFPTASRENHVATVPPSFKN